MSSDEYLYFAGNALDGMCRIAVDLGDDLANRRPEIPGANTPHGLLIHCLGVANYWAGALVAGRRVERDRDAEFLATGPVARLGPLVEQAKAQLAEDIAGAVPEAPLRRQPDAEYQGPPQPLTQGSVLLHVLEELCQHHGQMEVIRDALRVEAQPDKEAGR
jgi:uncharacterized damage-inducible protein DinB